MKRVHKMAPNGSVGSIALYSGDPWFIVSWKTGNPDKNFCGLPEAFPCTKF